MAKHLLLVDSFAVSLMLKVRYLNIAGSPQGMLIVWTPRGQKQIRKKPMALEQKRRKLNIFFLQHKCAIFLFFFFFDLASCQQAICKAEITK